MPNFKQSILYLGVLLGILLLLHFLYFPISFYFFIALILAFFGIIVFGAARIDSNFFIETICKGDTTEKVIALTFDDGPDATHTPPLLDFLKKHELLATFFCIGKKIDEQEDLVKRIDREGHLLGNHSYSHSKVFDFFLSKVFFSFFGILFSYFFLSCYSYSFTFSSSSVCMSSLASSRKLFSVP